MALEQFFKNAHTFSKLRNGPLGNLLEEFCQWLLTHGYSRRCSIQKLLGNLSHLNVFLAGSYKAQCKRITSADIDGFYKVYSSCCRHRGPLQKHLRYVGFSINRFIAYLQNTGRFDSCRSLPTYQCLRDAYAKWVCERQHSANGTLGLRTRYIEKFLEWLGPQATIKGLSKLTAARVEQFIIAYAQNSGPAARRSMQTTLRTFLRFALHNGWIREHLDLAVPTFRTYKLSTVPRGLSEAQASIVLASVDRGSPVGKRDYAILQMLYSYGVRGGQVRNLRLSDIQWQQDQIRFRACKHGKDSLLPLTAEVGASLLDYLQNARPHGPWPEVFLTCRSPYRPIPSSTTLSEIVRKHIRATGVEVSPQGSHAFRHCFATRMVAQGHSLKAVADVLGHRYLSTTFIYTKVDFAALRQVALDWPEEVNS
jgi:integrase/recombinase XerD